MADRPKHLVTGDSLRWTMVLYKINGDVTDADALPTFSIIKNGTPLVDTVAVVHRDVGTYDCIYTPIDANEEGDQFTVEEHVVILSQAYVNVFEFIVNALEPTGTGVNQVVATVRDELGQLVSGAVVNVLDSGGTSLGFQSTTNTLGEAPFNLNDGSYQFVISAIVGYQSHIPEPYIVSAAQTTPNLTIYHEVTPTLPVEQDPNDIDLSGVKKVKTKHMEIEAFDPRIMQDARDRENAAPSFCEVEMCRGVHARYRRCCK